MRVAIGVDHGGFTLKQAIVDLVMRSGHQVVDCGAYEYVASDDYPDFARAVAYAVTHGDAERGILICGSGVGACVAANKIKGARACVCHDTYSARQGVEHDDMNILCLGARVIGDQLAAELVRVFLNATFSGESRHRRRLEKVLALERGE